MISNSVRINLTVEPSNRSISLSRIQLKGPIRSGKELTTLYNIHAELKLLEKTHYHALISILNIC